MSDAFNGHLNVRHGQVKLSIIPNFNMQIDIDHSLTGSLSKVSGSDLLRRDDPIGSISHSLSYDATFSGLNRILLHQQGLDLQIDSLVNSFTSTGDSQISAWKGSETIGKAIGGQPGAVQLHRQSSSESGKAPGFRNRKMPYTIFKADVLTCTEDEDGTPLCGPVNFCKDGSLNCDEPSGPDRGRADASQRRSVHLHLHKQQSVHRQIVHDTGKNSSHGVRKSSIEIKRGSHRAFR